MNSFKKQGKIIIFVSHQLDNVEKFCNKGLLINKGQQIFYGDVDTAISKYKKLK